MRRMASRLRKQSDRRNKDGNYISMPEACKLLFLTECGVRYYIGQHRLRGFKSGGKWYLSKDNVETLALWLKFQKKKHN